MQAIFEKYISEVYSSLFENTNKTEEQSDQDANKFFESELKKADVKTITKDYTINLIKTNKTWKIVNDDNLAKSLLDVESLNNVSNTENLVTSNPTKE